MAKINVWKCKLIFPIDTLQQKIEITDLKPFFSSGSPRLVICFPHAESDWLSSAGEPFPAHRERLALLGWWSAFLTQRATGSPRLVIHFPHTESDWLSSAGDLLSSHRERLALLGWWSTFLTQRVTGSPQLVTYFPHAESEENSVPAEESQFFLGLHTRGCCSTLSTPTSLCNALQGPAKTDHTGVIVRVKGLKLPKTKLKLKSQGTGSGSGTQLKQALTSITLTSTFIIFNKTALRLPGG